MLISIREESESSRCYTLLSMAFHPAQGKMYTDKKIFLLAVLNSDYTTGLSCLMKYPSNINVMFIIRYSLHLHAPDVSMTAIAISFAQVAQLFFCLDPFTLQKYEKPLNAQNRRPAKTLHPHNLRQLDGRSSSASGHPSKHTNQIRNNATQPMQTINATHSAQRGTVQHRMKQSPSKSEQIRERVNTLQNSTAKATIRAANKPQLNQEPGVVDGYLENVSASIHNVRFDHIF